MHSVVRTGQLKDANAAKTWISDRGRRLLSFSRFAATPRGDAF